ncbi:solute carrier organic anion transporter family member 6A1 isoform X1 [Manis javanica]|uniref:solute carrier organic anion transporter family member 6A1 isoform X1 n=1 Tax=Manis javanica TaxID=9974 RepID=UPI003C6D1912
MRGIGDVEPTAAQARPAAGTWPRETWKARREPRGIRTFLISLTKLRSLRKRERHPSDPKAPISKKPGDLDEKLEGPCGLGCVVVPGCQRFNNIHCFLFFYCVLVTSQGIVFALVDLSIDTFQKENNLKTTESYALSLTYDISSCLIVVFISYYGGRGNIPRWITVSSFLIGFGSLLCAFPYFSGGNNQMNVQIEDICQEKKIVIPCKKSSLESKYVPFFILGQTVQGIAAIPLYILGVAFLDNSVATHSAGIYLGFVEASVIIGYSLGYAIGAPLIKASENSTFEKSIENSDNQYWLRTWWIRFVFVSVIAWSTLIPLSCFPHNIQGTAKIKARKPEQPNLFHKFEDREFGTSMKDLFAAIWILVKNPVFLCLTLSKASESLITIGASEILPIYIENQFVLTPSMATTLSGLVLIPGGAIGQLLGGVIVSKLEMSCKNLMRFIMVTSVVALILLALTVFVHCNPVPFAGINEDYGRTGQLGNLTAPCNSYCRCLSSFYSPICGRDDIGYFSPCFAGCTHSKTFNDLKAYYNCSCIKEGLTISDDEGELVDAKPGTCDAKCYKLPLFLAFSFSSIVFSEFSGVPSTLIILWIVSDKQRVLALGVTYVILRIFGTIPGPVIFKMIGESSCTFRDIERCGKKGSCWFYNKTKMARLLIGLCFSCKIFTVFFTAIAFGIYKFLLKENSDIPPIPVKNLKVKKKERAKGQLDHHGQDCRTSEDQSMK